ncbi:MAG: peptidoglycan bridge formation glycyltransferase FemA/FemB family protein [Dehalococcoidales bacterium]|nr:peptidoglycan bridge formation glycyltransferase FemA/FemB family protein [Dehalococcoidales bacterium]
MATALPGGNILQSYEWGEFKTAFGWRPLRLVVEREGRPLAGAQMLLRGSPLGAIAYIPRGPLVSLEEQAAADLLLSTLHEQARAAGACFLKIEPNLANSGALAKNLSIRRFCPSDCVQPRSTIIVDLTAEPVAMEKRLSRRIRYNIRLARRKGLRCARGDGDDLGEFYRLLTETAARGNFFVHPLSYYQELWERFAARGMAHLMLVRFGEAALAATMFLTAGDRAYQLYSASTTNLRHLKPNDLLQWSALVHARELGCRSYDLWGIPDEVGRRSEQGEPAGAVLPEGEKPLGGTMYGVYAFKRGFGGSVVRTVGAYDFAYAPVRYWLWVHLVPAARRLAVLAAGRIRRSNGKTTSPAMEAYEA